MQNTDLGGGFRLERAETSLFAVYQAIYSEADVEMWYDWKMRVNDTMWAEDCFFLTCDGQKLAGVITKEGKFLYPFLIPPFCDRALFYRLLHRAVQADLPSETRTITAIDVLDADVETLLTMGYRRTIQSRRVMVRPTDRFAVTPSPGFEIVLPEPGNAESITAMINQAFAGGIHAEAYGPLAAEDVAKWIENATATGTLNVSSLVYETTTHTLVGACLAGISLNAVNGFAFVSDMGVLPEYQNRGLGALMLLRALTQAHPHAPVMKLVVTIGNPAEALYRRLGFLPGPRFTRMTFNL